MPLPPRAKTDPQFLRLSTAGGKSRRVRASHVNVSSAHLVSKRLTIFCKNGVPEGKATATSVMDMGSASSDAGVQPAEPEVSEEGEEEREKIVVEWRLRVRVKGIEALFLIKGRMMRGTLTSGDEVMRAFKSCWNVTRPEGMINGTGDEGMLLSSGL